MSDLYETKFTCSICSKTEEVYEIDVDTYNKNLDSLSKYGKYILGLRCQNCDTCYCWRDHKNELKFRRWDGYEKTSCLQCGEPLGRSAILLRKDQELEKIEQELKKSTKELNNSETSPSQKVHSTTEKNESSEISKKQSKMNKGKSYMTVGAVIFIIKLLISYTGMDKVMLNNYPNVLMICAAFFMLLGIGYFIAGEITKDKE